jgi:hypothetical protein
MRPAKMIAIAAIMLSYATPISPARADARADIKALVDRYVAAVKSLSCSLWLRPAQNPTVLRQSTAGFRLIAMEQWMPALSRELGISHSTVRDETQSPHLHPAVAIVAGDNPAEGLSREGSPSTGRKASCRCSSATPGKAWNAWSEFKSWTPAFARESADLLAFRERSRQLTRQQWSSSASAVANRARPRRPCSSPNALLTSPTPSSRSKQVTECSAGTHKRTSVNIRPPLGGGPERSQSVTVFRDLLQRCPYGITREIYVLPVEPPLCPIGS